MKLHFFPEHVYDVVIVEWAYWYANERKWHFDKKRDSLRAHFVASVEASVDFSMIFTFSSAVIWAKKNGQLFLMIASSQAVVKVFFSTLLDVCLVWDMQTFCELCIFFNPYWQGHYVSEAICQSLKYLDVKCWNESWLNVSLFKTKKGIYTMDFLSNTF